MMDPIARFALEWKRLLLVKPRKTMEVSFFQEFRDDFLNWQFFFFKRQIGLIARL